MTVLSIHHWDFHRLAESFDPRFETCSVAVFQWQPKASGKGQKQVNACRICGYTADVQSVYRKAQEICDRLNSEQATVTNRPKWLQKQYSVPRPPSVVKPVRAGTRVSASAVRSLRERVMQRRLLPAGFVRAVQATWVRRRGDQIQLVYFQGSQYGQEYFVNLGIHYTYLSPLFAGKKLPLAKYRLLDCGLRARLPEAFSYGSDLDELENTFGQNSMDCLREFGTAERKFANPCARFIAKNERHNPPGGIWWIDDDGFYHQLQRLRSERART